MIVNLGEAASKRSFQPSASNLAAYRLQLSMCSGQLGWAAFSLPDAASEWSFGIQLGSFELSPCSFESLVLSTALGKSLQLHDAA